MCSEEEKQILMWLFSTGNNYIREIKLFPILLWQNDLN